MMAPFFNHDAFGLQAGLALAVLLGMGFGFTLERGGFGSSRRLAAQFYLHDMTVFKVMFTAIITAMVGLFGLVRLGFVDLDLVWINPTFLWPQIVGGLLLGMGFILSGYCPGTSIVAAASGKIDAIFAIVGVLIGIFVFGVAYGPALQAFHVSGALDRLTLFGLLGVPALPLAIGVAAMAGMAFVGAEWVERRFAHLAPDPAPRWNPRTRWAVVGGLLLAGLLFLALPAAAPRDARAAVSARISAMNLAEAIVAGEAGLVILDLRSASEFEAGSIPGAVPVGPEELANAGALEERLPPGHRAVLVDAGDGAAARVLLPGSLDARALEGGFPAWKALLDPSTAEGGTSPRELARRAALASFFLGAAVAVPAGAPGGAAPSGGARKKRGGGC
jgi:hypothetical protein